MSTVTVRSRPWLLALLFMALAVSARADIVVPPFMGWVTDTAGALRQEARRWLEANLQTLKSAKQVEMAVLVVPDLQGTTVEDYAQRVYDQWKIGDKESRRGLLLLVAVNDRKVRLHVGYGLEGDLPDGKAGALIDSAVLPGFRAGDLSAGVIGGVTAVMSNLGVATVQNIPGATRSHRRRSSSGSNLGFILMMLFVLGLAGVSPTWRWILLNMLLNSSGGSRSYGGGGSVDFGGGSGFGGFGGGSSGGGGASRGW